MRKCYLQGYGDLQRRSQFYLHVGICFFDLFLDCFCYYVVVQSLLRVQLFATPGTQHTRLLCPSIPPAICSNSCPLSRWCHPTISSSVALFSFCPQSLPETGSFPVNWLFAWGGQITAASTLATMNLIFQWSSRLISLRRDWFSLLTVQGSLKSFLQHNLKASIFQHSAFFMSSSHICTWLLEKP